MSHIAPTIPSCPQIQDMLVNYFDFDPHLKMEGVVLLPFLKSPENTRGILQRDISDKAGKKRRVEVLYSQRYLEDEAGSTHQFTCNSDRGPGLLSQTYEFGTQATSANFKIALADLDESCPSFEWWFMRELLKNISLVDRAVETKTSTELAALYGAFASFDNDVVANIKTVATQKADGDLDENFASEIDYSLSLLGYGGRPLLWGDGEIYKAMKKLSYGCCANDGLDMGAFYDATANFRLLKSYRAIEALGENRFMMLQPNAVQLLTFNKLSNGDGNMTIDEVDRKATTIVSPFTGMTYDMVLNLTCDADSAFVWNVSLAVTHQLAVMPSDMFHVGDNLYGINGINLFNISNPA